MNEQVLNARWAEAGAKLVDLAESFPVESYDARPAGEVRSFAEQLRHVAFWNRWLGDTLRGGAPDGGANELPPTEYPDKARIVGALRGSFRDVTDALASANGKSLETALPILEHVAEHYGQLVVYCRVNGVVPPASR